MNLVEKVARAIHESQFIGEMGDRGTVEYEQFMQCARAAIEAMREPTEEMLDAQSAFESFEGRNIVLTYDRELAKETWQGMISEALK